MILQTYSWKWATWNSALKITWYSVAPKTDTTNDITIQINRYTDSTCEYDIEQFTKVFTDVSTVDVPLDDLPILETMLLNEPEFVWATIPS